MVRDIDFLPNTQLRAMLRESCDAYLKASSKSPSWNLREYMLESIETKISKLATLITFNRDLNGEL